jgi:hypothetical protein
MNMSAGDKAVYVAVTYTYRGAYDSVRAVKPVWLEIDNCGDSEYSIPAGYSEKELDMGVDHGRQGRWNGRSPTPHRPVDPVH